MPGVVTDRPDKPPEEAVLAAEYVLGVLSEDARAAFEQRLRREPELAAEMRRWESHFATLADLEVESVTPPTSVLQTVEAKIYCTAAPTSLWDRVAFWRGRGFAGLATSAALAALLLLPGPDAPPVDGIPPSTILITTWSRPKVRPSASRSRGSQTARCRSVVWQATWHKDARRTCG